MAELDQKLDHTLPLLPLTSGVVLPGMVVTMALETPEARAAVDAAASADGQLLLVPRVDGRYAKVGTISRIEEAGQLPSGVPALVVRGLPQRISLMSCGVVRRIVRDEEYQLAPSNEG